MKPNPALDFKSLFKPVLSIYLVPLPDFSIAITETYLKATMTAREDLIGQDFFEMFPDITGDIFYQWRFQFSGVP